MNASPEITTEELSFLAGEGEMFEITRAVDWASTSLGPVEKWPRSLKSTLGIVLHSGFPKVLFWGEDLICFYNDAFRPSLGVDGKHPAVGKKGKDMWADIWDFIGPLIDSVLTTGKAVKFNDQLVPFYRNGRTEDIYWTFSYSPAYGDDGKVNGVFVTCTETTEKVQTLARLSENKQELEFAIEAGELATFDFNPATNKFRANQRLLDWFGLRRGEEFDIAEAYQSILPSDRERVNKAIQESLDPQGTGLYEIEYTIVHPVTKTERVLHAKGKCTFDEKKVPIRMNGTLQDITVEKNYRKRLQENEAQMRSMIESAPFPIGVYIGKEMRIQFANKSILDIWGKGYGVIGKLYREVLPELASQKVFEQLDEVYTTGKAIHIKNERIDLVVDGKNRIYFFEYNFTPLFDSYGKVYGVMNTAADLTELNLAKIAIQKSEENLRNTILQAPVAMCILRGPEFVVNLANERMYQVWGRPPGDVLGKPIFIGLPEAKGQGFEEILKGVYESGKTFSALAVPVNLPRNGTIEKVYLNYVYEAYREATGEITGILAVAVDVTLQVHARKEIEEVVKARTQELAEANKDLHRSNAELAQFAYIASHDLQEPLRKISTFSQMIEAQAMDQLDEKSKSYLEKIRKAATRMTNLIRDVLNYSVLTKEGEDFELVDLEQVVLNALTDHELSIEQKQARIVHTGLPVVEAIPLQMAQLFTNLLNNALKYSRVDVQPLISVTGTTLQENEKAGLGLSAHGTYTRITFSDNGIGFKPEFAETVFSIFRRLHRKAEYEGTGIGLAMCKKIVTNHGGRIDADGSSEEGAVFNIILPLRQAGI